MKKGSKPKRVRESIKVLKKFKDLFPSTEESKKEMELLEENILNYGVRDPLVVCKETGILLDGYRRLAICKRRNIPYKITKVSLSGHDAARRWIVRNQLSRRNLNSFQKAQLVIELGQDDYLKQAKANQALSKGRGKKGQRRTDEVFEPVDVSQRLADDAGISRDSMSKARYILKHGNDDIVGDLANDRMKINTAYYKIREERKRSNKQNVSGW